MQFTFRDDSRVINVFPEIDTIRLRLIGPSIIWKVFLIRNYPIDEPLDLLGYVSPFILIKITSVNSIYAQRSSFHLYHK